MDLINGFSPPLVEFGGPPRDIFLLARLLAREEGRVGRRRPFCFGVVCLPPPPALPRERVRVRALHPY